MSLLKGKDIPSNDQFNKDEFEGIIFFEDQRKAQNKEAHEKRSEPRQIISEKGPSSPLDALINSVNRTVEEIKSQTAELKPKVAVEVKTEQERAEAKEKRESSLLAKCMPYIYDEQGVNYAEEKPDYTLESVEEIIESAERRADERLAKMYNLKASEIKRIGKDNEAKPSEAKPRLLNEETSIKKPVKIGDEAFSAAKLFETASIPKISETLFDDLTTRRTDVIGEEKVTSVYSAQGGMESREETHTKAIPDLTPETNANERYEDILSHTRPVNVVDISSSSGKKIAPVFEESESEEEYIDDFKGEKDIKRVGNMLKAAAFIARLRLFATAILTVLAGTLLIEGVKALFGTVAVSIIEAVLLGLALLVNSNIFGGFKGAFRRNSKVELPLAIMATVAALYFVYGIISATYPTGVAVLPLATLAIYTFCAGKSAKAIFGGFKIVAMRKSKTAVNIISDPSVTSAMARSQIQGEVLAAAQRQTDEIEDFLLHTTKDTALSGRVGVLTAVSVIAALFIGLAASVSLSLEVGLYAAVIVLCLCCSPTLFIADIMPFVGMSEHLWRYRAFVCSKDSAEKIEQINVVVVSSKDIFPAGTIKLYNITPLSANELDETLEEAAAVAKLIESPLSPVFLKILSSDVILPEADSVKYEDNLGISGWVGDDHVLIGNRSLMIAHGVRIPALEIDKKMLRQGYFPVYVAINQRACALLSLGYTVDRHVEKRLWGLQDNGITLLVDNCDPNITEQMLSDYFGFYSDLVKILDHSGAHKYKQATEPTDKVSAHGFHRGDTDSFLEILRYCIRLRFTKNLLQAIHILSAVAMPTIFAVLLLGSAVEFVGVGLCLLGELIALIVSLTAYFATKL